MDITNMPGQDEQQTQETDQQRIDREAAEKAELAAMQEGFKEANSNSGNDFVLTAKADINPDKPDNPGGTEEDDEPTKPKPAAIDADAGGGADKDKKDKNAGGSPSIEEPDKGGGDNASGAPSGGAEDLEPKTPLEKALAARLAAQDDRLRRLEGSRGRDSQHLAALMKEKKDTEAASQQRQAKQESAQKVTDAAAKFKTAKEKFDAGEIDEDALEEARADRYYTMFEARQKGGGDAAAADSAPQKTDTIDPKHVKFHNEVSEKHPKYWEISDSADFQAWRDLDQNRKEASEIWDSTIAIPLLDEYKAHVAAKGAQKKADDEAAKQNAVEKSKKTLTRQDKKKGETEDQAMERGFKEVYSELMGTG